MVTQKVIKCSPENSSGDLVLGSGQAVYAFLPEQLHNAWNELSKMFRFQSFLCREASSAFSQTLFSDPTQHTRNLSGLRALVNVGTPAQQRLAYGILLGYEVFCAADSSLRDFSAGFRSLVRRIVLSEVELYRRSVKADGEEPCADRGVSDDERLPRTVGIFYRGERTCGDEIEYRRWMSNVLTVEIARSENERRASALKALSNLVNLFPSIVFSWEERAARVLRVLPVYSAALKNASNSSSKDFEIVMSLLETGESGQPKWMECDGRDSRASYYTAVSSTLCMGALANVNLAISLFEDGEEGEFLAAAISRASVLLCKVQIALPGVRRESERAIAKLGIAYTTLNPNGSAWVPNVTHADVLRYLQEVQKYILKRQSEISPSLTAPIGIERFDADTPLPSGLLGELYDLQLTRVVPEGRSNGLRVADSLEELLRWKSSQGSQFFLLREGSTLLAAAVVLSNGATFPDYHKILTRGEERRTSGGVYLALMVASEDASSRLGDEVSTILCKGISDYCLAKGFDTIVAWMRPDHPGLRVAAQQGFEICEVVDIQYAGAPFLAVPITMNTTATTLREAATLFHLCRAREIVRANRS